MREPKKSRNLRFEAGKWYLDFTFRGKRIRQFGGYTKDQARNSLTKMKAELLDVARGFKKPAVPEEPFEKFGSEVIEVYCKPNKRSWSRDELSLCVLNRFFKGQALAAIGPADIEAFKAKRRTEVSDSSVNRELAFLKTMFNLAVQWGRLEKSPAALVKKFREPASRERILNASEAARLIDAAGADLRPILIVALGTGMRRGEILGLKWADTDLVRGIITVTMSKSGKPRKVPLSGAVASALGAVPRRGEYVFMNVETGTHIKDVKIGFKAACARAEIAGVRFHDLRHTFASRALELGADIMTVSKILGHSSITMTAKYLHPTGESMRAAVGRVADFLDPSRQKVDTIEVTKSLNAAFSGH